MTTQTEAQRLADAIEARTTTYGECREAAALLLRQEALIWHQQELLKQALEKFELIAAGEDYGKIDGLITAIRAHREAK